MCIADYLWLLEPNCKEANLNSSCCSEHCNSESMTKGWLDTSPNGPAGLLPHFFQPSFFWEMSRFSCFCLFFLRGFWIQKDPAQNGWTGSLLTEAAWRLQASICGRHAGIFGHPAAFRCRKPPCGAMDDITGVPILGGSFGWLLCEILGLLPRHPRGERSGGLCRCRAGGCTPGAAAGQVYVGVCCDAQF